MRKGNWEFPSTRGSEGLRDRSAGWGISSRRDRQGLEITPIGIITRIAREAESRDVRVVSVDVFDTLLLRSTRSEIDRFFDVAKIQSKRLAELGIEASPESLFYARMVCSRIAYQTAPLNRTERAASIESIVALMANFFGLGTDISYLFLEIEIDYELQCLTGDRDLAVCLRELRRKGMCVFFLSDMYLSTRQIQFLLKALLPEFEYDGGYVSSDYSLTKRGGGLYDHFMVLHDLKPEEVLHVGDDFRSDFLVPVQKGIHAICRPRSFNWYFRRFFRERIARRKLREYLV